MSRSHVVRVTSDVSQGHGSDWGRFELAHCRCFTSVKCLYQRKQFESSYPIVTGQYLEVKGVFFRVLNIQIIFNIN